jgi:hypothetical protein
MRYLKIYLNPGECSKCTDIVDHTDGRPDATGEGVLADSALAVAMAAG